MPERRSHPRDGWAFQPSEFERFRENPSEPADARAAPRSSTFTAPLGCRTQRCPRLENLSLENLSFEIFSFENNASQKTAIHAHALFLQAFYSIWLPSTCRLAPAALHAEVLRES
jgi:hypothetical protein